MLTPALVASLHHLLAFAVVGLLLAEMALLRHGIGAEDRRRLGRIDLAYGALFGVLVVVGIVRVVWTEKGWDFYEQSLPFWIKIAALVGVTLLSLPPTFTYIRWGRATKANPMFQPESSEIKRLQGYLKAELVLLAVVPVAAAAMARAIG